MTPEWEQAIRSGNVDRLEQLHSDGASLDGRDRFGQTGLMVASAHGVRATVEWLVGQGARLDHTAKYHLSAVMLAVINGHTEIVRTLVEAGADLELRGSGAPGFAGKTALDLARDRQRDDLVEALTRAPAGSST